MTRISPPPLLRGEGKQATGKQPGPNHGSLSLSLSLSTTPIRLLVRRKPEEKARKKKKSHAVKRRARMAVLHKSPIDCSIRDRNESETTAWIKPPNFQIRQALNEEETSVSVYKQKGIVNHRYQPEEPFYVRHQAPIGPESLAPSKAMVG